MPEQGYISGENERELLDAEFEFISSRLGKTGHSPETLVGLALSGGGIRSATFCLGVMQALTRRGWMKHVDYLSTVSGGGYIGSSLSWFLSGCGSQNGSSKFGVTPDNIPFGAADPTNAAEKTRMTNESCWPSCVSTAIT